MSPLRTALLLAIAGTAGSALAEQITCESRGNRPEACGTVQPGSSVRLVQQLSGSPCIEGRTWGSNDDSIWVSQGCRAVFDVQPRYDNGVAENRDDGYVRERSDDRRAPPRYAEQREADRNDEDRINRDDSQREENQRDEQPRHEDRGYEDRRHEGRGYDERRYANSGGRRDSARQSCIDRVVAEYSFGPDEVTTSAVRWIGEGKLSVSLDTPQGLMACTVDREGNIRLIDER